MDLLERFVRGDVNAFETLFRQFQREVYGWILRIVRNPAIAEELTLDAFWRIYRGHARFDARRPFGAWARRIASNVAVDHLKKARREAQLSPDASLAPARDPAITRETQRSVERAFRQLSPRLRVVAALALIEERPYAEISEALGISVGAVKSRVFRACRLLRGNLKRMGVEP